MRVEIKIRQYFAQKFNMLISLNSEANQLEMVTKKWRAADDGVFQFRQLHV